MFRCVECLTPALSVISYKASLPELVYCSNSTHLHFVDKYFAYSNTILFIDLLLQKRQIIRHFVFNTKKDYLKIFKLGLIVVLCKILFQLLEIKETILLIDACNILKFALKCITKYFVINFIKYTFLFNNIEFDVYWKIILISSYYHLVLPLLIIWKCNEKEYYHVIVVFSEISNIISITFCSKLRLINVLLRFLPVYLFILLSKVNFAYNLL